MTKTTTPKAEKYYVVYSRTDKGVFAQLHHEKSAAETAYGNMRLFGVSNATGIGHSRIAMTIETLEKELPGVQYKIMTPGT